MLILVVNRKPVLLLEILMFYTVLPMAKKILVKIRFTAGCISFRGCLCGCQPEKLTVIKLGWLINKVDENVPTTMDAL